MKAHIEKLQGFTNSFEKQLKKSLSSLEMLQIKIDLLDKEKMSIKQFKVEKKESEEIMYKVHTVMDYYSNEFMRLENFMEKYLPIKVQNLISHTFNNLTKNSNKWKLKDYEDQRFMELREKLLDDSGMPDLERECYQIIEDAKEYVPIFQDAQKDPEEVKGLQN